jgi:hypothetical protein
VETPCRFESGPGHHKFSKKYQQDNLSSCETPAISKYKKGGGALAPEPKKVARETIDKLLTQAGWLVCDASQVNIHAARGVAIREFPLPGHGFADYLLYIDGKAAGVIEAKKEGTTLMDSFRIIWRLLYFT